MQKLCRSCTTLLSVVVGFQGGVERPLDWRPVFQSVPRSRAKWAVVLAAVGCVFLAGQAGWAASCSYSLTLPAGFSLIANQCDHPGGNTLDAVFPAVPTGSKINKFNNLTHSYEPTATFNGTWSPNLTLNPGEGAYFFNPGPTLTITISGDAHTPVLPLILTNGCYLVSRQEPLVAGYTDIV